MIPQCFKRFCHPDRMAVGLCVCLWALLVISCLHSWLDEHFIDKGVSYRMFPICFHLGIMGFKNDFSGWVSTLGFLFYIIAELIMLVNALTMEFKSKYKFCAESFVLFVLLFIYTCLVSWQHTIHQELQRKMHEEYVERTISSQFTQSGRREGCYRIPLGDGGAGPSKESAPFVSFSASTRK